MPTYEYKCDNCGHQFEFYQSMKDEKLKKCPSCGQDALKRLIGTGGGLIFKGSGFYLTDYKNKGDDKGTTSKKTSKEKSSNSTESKSDTKSDSTKPTSSETTSTKSESKLSPKKD